MKSIETVNEDGVKTIKIYSTYSQAQKRATQKYRINNKDKVNEQRKKYYLSRKEKDPNFLEYKRTKAKEYYQKKKLSKDEIKSEPIMVSVVEKIPESEPIIDDIVVVKEVVEKKKRKSPIKKVSIPETVKVEPEPEIIKVEEPFQMYSKKRKANKAI